MIVIRRPYDLGDKINIGDPTDTGMPSRLNWQVQGTSRSESVFDQEVGESHQHLPRCHSLHDNPERCSRQ